MKLHEAGNRFAVLVLMHTLTLSLSLSPPYTPTAQHPPRTDTRFALQLVGAQSYGNAFTPPSIDHHAGFMSFQSPASPLTDIYVCPIVSNSATSRLHILATTVGAEFKDLCLEGGDQITTDILIQ